MTTSYVGTTVTITRGANRGQEATGLSEPDTDGNFAVRTESNKTLVVNIKSVRAPEEPTMTESQVLEALEVVAIDRGLTDSDLAAFEKYLPGISEKLQERIQGE